MVFALQNRKIVNSIKVEHVRPDAGEARLWAPDQVLGAVGDALCGANECERWLDSWAKIDTRVTLLMATL